MLELDAVKLLVGLVSGGGGREGDEGEVVLELRGLVAAESLLVVVCGGLVVAAGLELVCGVQLIYRGVIFVPAL